MSTVTVGRNSDCHIVVNDATVSRRHAEISNAGGGRFVIRDTDSTGGTFVRDGDIWRRVHKATVSLRDVLRLGDHEISVADLLSAIRDPSVVLKLGIAEPRPFATAEVAGQAEPPRKISGGRFERDPATGLIIHKP